MLRWAGGGWVRDAGRSRFLAVRRDFVVHFFDFVALVRELRVRVHLCPDVYDRVCQGYVFAGRDLDLPLSRDVLEEFDRSCEPGLLLLARGSWELFAC